MQLCNAMLRRGGDVQHQIPMRDITPAEILVLRVVHGQDAVADIIPTKMDRRGHAEEWDRLAAKYDPQGGSFASSPDEERKSIMERLFPGAMRKLPVTLDEIGLGDLMNPHKRRKAAPAAEAEETGNGDETDTGEGNPTAGEYFVSEPAEAGAGEDDGA